MTTKELLEDIKKRGLELAKMCEQYRDMNEKGTYEYGFREGQATTWHNQVTWAEDMLETFFPDNAKIRHKRREPRSCLNRLVRSLLFRTHRSLLFYLSCTREALFLPAKKGDPHEPPPHYPAGYLYYKDDTNLSRD